MANPLIFDTFMGAKPQSPMEISENSDMDLDLEFPSNDLQLNAPVQSNAEADPEVFWGRNLHGFDPSHQMEFIDQMSKDMEAGGDLERSSPITILTLTELDITLDCDMTDMNTLDNGSEMGYLLDVFALAREDACELDIDHLPLFEYTMQPSGGTEVNVDMVSSTQKKDGSQLELVTYENPHSEPDEEPVGEGEWCELHTFRDHLQEMGFNNYEDFDEESWDRVLKGLEAEEESEAKPESRPNERGEQKQSTKRFKCTHTNCTKTFLYSQNKKAHIRRFHLREINYTCERCGKGFYSKAEFDSHMRRKTPCKRNE